MRRVEVRIQAFLYPFKPSVLGVAWKCQRGGLPMESSMRWWHETTGVTVETIGPTRSTSYIKETLLFQKILAQEGNNYKCLHYVFRKLPGKAIFKNITLFYCRTTVYAHDTPEPSPCDVHQS